MEQRLTQIEKDMAVMSEAMQHVATSLDKMTDVHIETKVIAGRIASMDRELMDSFKRVDREIKEIKDQRKWERSVLTGAVVSIVLLIIDKVL